MSDSEAIEDGFAMLADKITRETSFRCTSYKDKCLRRRIAVRMRARGAASFAAYAAVLDSDRSEYDRLVDALTVNVTKFFRNESTFNALAAAVIPELWRREGPLTAWSAGSASGEEAFSLAALFYEHAAAMGELNRIERVRVTGSDIDRASLLAAERARYAPASFADTPVPLLDRLFPATGDLRTVIEGIRTLVRFERRDILCDHPAVASYDLIACRNVIIYLDREAQEELLCSFHRALRPGGFLVLGRVETLLGQPRQLFSAVDIRERIFRKVR
ncbi:MAG: CheR family methyltransferase [Gemmatimonadaceae bacterium]